MEENYPQSVPVFSTSDKSTNDPQQIAIILHQQTDTTLSSFVSESTGALLALESWAWQILSQDSHLWITRPHYQELLCTLASFNKKLVYHYDRIEVDTKAALLFSMTISQIDKIFKQIEQTETDDDPFITITSLWFDNHSHFLHENPHYNELSISDHINQYIACQYLMSEQFQIYLTRLQRFQKTELLFTSKMLFYVTTSLFSIFSYLGAKGHHFVYSAAEILRYLGNDYLEIIRIHHHSVASWSKDLLNCIGNLTAVIAKCYWLDEKNGMQVETLFSTEQMTCDHVEQLIHIIAHKPFHKNIAVLRSNDETSLIDSVLMLLLVIVKKRTINWFFRSNDAIHDALLTVAESSLYDEICLRAYVIMGEVLTNEQLKELKIADSMTDLFFKMLEEAWQHSAKAYKQIPITYLLRDFQTLSKNDSIQQKTADSNKIPLLVELCDQYSTVYQIFWALSFNSDIQDQLRSNSTFMRKIIHLEKQDDNEEVRNMVHGILWNLEINHRDHLVSVPTDTRTFDIMISYSHSDKEFSRELYNELTKNGYRVWIDFDQLHGNIMDAMAQAIERSQSVIICMSEQYRQSNYCRAEAHYAFQRQRKIVPIRLQKHYKPDGWLLFLVGQLLYVDFTKHEFPPAMAKLTKELQSENTPKSAGDSTPTAQTISTSPTVSPSIRTRNILEWSQEEVKNWLMEQNLNQMSYLLTDCDGRSLIYLHRYMRHGELRHSLKSLQEDSLRKINQTLSILELARFQSLMDQCGPRN